MMESLGPLQVDRAAGVLIGGTAGDALGASYEYRPPCTPEAVQMGEGALTGSDNEDIVARMPDRRSSEHSSRIGTHDACTTGPTRRQPVVDRGETDERRHVEEEAWRAAQARHEWDALPPEPIIRYVRPRTDNEGITGPFHVRSSAPSEQGDVREGAPAKVELGCLVMLTNVSPRCLGGVEGEVMAIQGTRCVVRVTKRRHVAHLKEIDQRWVGATSRMITLERIPLSCCVVLSRPAHPRAKSTWGKPRKDTMIIGRGPIGAKEFKMPTWSGKLVTFRVGDTVRDPDRRTYRVRPDGSWGQVRS